MIPEFITNDENVADRFWRNVSMKNKDCCWEWGLSRHSFGYGSFSIKHISYNAHRVSWTLYHKKMIPAGMVIMHKCDNPPCVNPNHLQLGTQGDNNRDTSRKGRHRNNPPKGVDHHLNKLSEDEVRFIRLVDGISSRKLGKLFNVDHKVIINIKHRKIWKHVN